MKILHTADWHVGKTLHRRQRLEETDAVLGEVIAIAAAENVDLTLVCGDLFDQYAPSAESERIVYRALVNLRATGSAVLVIPGNHDNPKRFAAIEQLSGAAGIHVVPEVRRPQAGGIVEVPSRDGKQVAQVAALPWVPEKALFGAEEMMGLEEDPNKAYAEELPRLLEALCSMFEPGKIHVMAGHVFVGGSRIGGGERELTVGDLFAIAPQGLPKTPQYIALGHVHRPQDIAAAAVPARYAGSLLQLDFGEREQDKNVTLVTADPGQPAKVHKSPISGGRKLLDVTGTLDELRTQKVDPDAYLRVLLRCDGPAPGLADDVRMMLPMALEVRLDYERAPGARDGREKRRLAPRDLFARYYTDRHGAPADERLVRLFDELFEEVAGEAAKLAIEGFTAFRDLQEIDFEPLELFVITGPTGAGKTSILDAMVFALYGQVPRLGGKQGTTDLVSLGTVQARVLFEFSIAGKGRYRVARRLKRGAAQTATLERLDGDKWVSACDRSGVRECDRVLNELLGLDYDSFCKAVVLPQGEFHRFLKGDPNERRQVLVSLLGVSYFQRMGAIARQRQSDLNSKVERTEEILTEQYAEATAEAVEEAHTASATAAEHRTALTASLAKAEERSSEAAEHDRIAEVVRVRADELEALAVAAREKVDACHTAEAAKTEAATRLAVGAADLEASRLNATAAQKALTTLQAELGTAEKIAEAAAAARTLHTAGLEEQSAQDNLDKAQETQASASRALADAKKAETKAEPQLQNALAAEKERTLALEEAGKRTQKLAQLLIDARRHDKDVQDSHEQLVTARTVAAGARTEAQKLRGILDEAVAHLERHRRANAVAELADGLATGAPCPICGVPLASPIAVATDLADALTIARSNEQVARSAAETAAEKATREEANVEAAEKQKSDREQRQSQTLDGHKNLAAIEAESSKAAAAATTAAEQFAKSQRQRETLQSRRDEAHDQHLNASGELAGCEGLTEAARGALADVRKRKSCAAKTLAKHFGGKAPENAAEEIAEQRTRLLEATETTQAARAELDQASERHETARTAVEVAERQLTDLDVELTRLRTKAEDAAAASAELLTGIALQPDLPDAGSARDASTAELASWCDTVAQSLSGAREAAVAAGDAAQQQVVTIAAEREIDASNAERALALLRTAERTARDAATKAQSAAEEAERRAGERRVIEERIKDEREQITILGDLALELRSDRFGDYIILETLDLLAARASEELLRISGERYSLVSVEGDFQVVDHANADEQRSIKTLSGGEIFLASLALALALSRHVGDLAAEGLGVKLEAVFIDEGFGTLDPETLEEVIDALERLRADDLVVGVISHVPELSQRVRSGLEVQKQEGRSRIVESVGT